MGGQRELRRHKPEWNVAPVRSLHEPAPVRGGNSDANADWESESNSYSNPNTDCNGHTDCNGNSNCYCNGYSHGHAHCHRYSNAATHTYAKVPANAQTSPYSAAAFVTRKAK
jgi:hypothetical protein